MGGRDEYAYEFRMNHGAFLSAEFHFVTGQELRSILALKPCSRLAVLDLWGNPLCHGTSDHEEEGGGVDLGLFLGASIQKWSSSIPGPTNLSADNSLLDGANKAGSGRKSGAPPGTGGAPATTLSAPGADLVGASRLLEEGHPAAAFRHSDEEHEQDEEWLHSTKKTSLKPTKDYRWYLVWHLPKLKVLDGVPIHPSEDLEAKDRFAGRLTMEILEEKLGRGWSCLVEAVHD